MKWQGREIEPYESFYWDESSNSSFQQGQLGGGISRTVKTKNSLATVTIEYYDEQNNRNRKHRDDRKLGVAAERQGLLDGRDQPDAEHDERGGLQPKVMVREYRIAAQRGRNPENPSERGRSNGNYRQRLELGSTETSNTLTTVQKDNLILETEYFEPQVLTPKRTEYGKAVRKEYESGIIEESRHNMTRMEPRTDGVANTLTTVQKDNLLLMHEGWKREDGTGRWYRERIRILTPRECFRLMDVSEEDIDRMVEAGISKSQLYKLAGNSIVVAVLEAIFRQMFCPAHTDEPTLF